MLVTSDTRIEIDLERFLDQELGKDLLRFTTAGSVDDGKSTLIGRLLHDCKAVYEDQLASVKKSRINRSGREIDFSLLTDGLRAEREQGITIDVAYRYFSTAKRKFIIADTPGHEQYTRNMATGASTADLAVILVDATKGLLSQTRRHAYIASLLGISHVLVAVNKMDLVGYREEVFSRLRDDFSELARQLDISHVQAIPVSALDGENIVTRSDNTSWYSGPTMLEHLETVTVQPAARMDALRFPVQSVVRPDASFRGFAGRVASGAVCPGDEVLALPSRQRTKVEAIVSFDGDLPVASFPQSVVLKLADEIDVSRGDFLVSPGSEPFVSARFAAMVVWLDQNPLELNRTYLAKHAGRQVKAKATRIRFRVDINNLTELRASRLEMNEIASMEFTASQALFFDPYDRNRTTGSFILIDPLTNATVGAGMIREELAANHKNGDAVDQSKKTAGEGSVTLEERFLRRGHRPAIVTVTASGSEIEDLERDLFNRGFETVFLRDDQIQATVQRALIDTLWNLGLIIIVWSEAEIDFAHRTVFRGIAGESFFDLSSESRTADEPSDFRSVIEIAETLRVGDAATESRKG